MFGFLFKKQQQIETLIFNYIENFRKTQKLFSDAFTSCKSDPFCSDFDFLTKQTHKYESRGDDIRDEINDLMYGKALLPESREDIMRLLESVDKILGHFETILHIIKGQKVVIPDFIMPKVQELFTFSLESCDLMLKQIEALFSTQQGIRELVSDIDLLESRCDHIERSLISAVFSSDLDLARKIEVKELILMIGNISDQVDRVSKRVNIIRMKRIV
ncbi:MAG: hypothetical protein DRH32_02320 [Deltaproteobacteria bacterium]|nr:MAG: hypothetical protein DRH32_02320 [Deltaproteobacteria bacterium]